MEMHNNVMKAMNLLELSGFLDKECLIGKICQSYHRFKASSHLLDCI